MEFRYHRKHESGKVPVAHADRFRMGPGLEDDLLVLRERLIDVHIEPIEVAEGRHRAQLAVGKQACDLILGREPHVVGCKDSSQAMEIHIPTGRQHCHHEPLLHLHDHDLGHLLLRGMERLRDGKGAKRFRVGQHIIMNPLTIEICFECS